MNLRIGSIKVSNVGPHKELVIYGDREVIEFAGDNGTGKTFAMWMARLAMGGKEKSVFPQVLRIGSRKGMIELELNDDDGVPKIFVKRTFGKNDSSNMKAKDDEGKPISQTELKELFNEFSFDPLAFARLKNTELIAKFKSLDPDTATKIDNIDTEMKYVYGKRAGLSSQLKNTNWPAKVEKVEAPNMGAIEDEMQQIEEWNDLQRSRSERKVNMQNDIAIKSTAIKGVESQIEQYTKELYRLRGEHAELTRDAEAMPEPEPAKSNKDVLERLRMAGEQTAQATTYQLFKARIEEKSKLEREYNLLDDNYASLKETRTEVAASAKLPIEGVEWDGDRLLIDGVCWEQACTSERYRISFAMMQALNPSLKVLYMHRSESLDDSKFRAIVEDYVKQGYQCFVEKVGAPRTSDAMVFTKAKEVSVS